MSLLNVLEGLIAGVRLGAYLFTTFVVSPALKSLPLSDGERIRTRSTIGRRMQALADREVIEEKAMAIAARDRSALQRLSARITPISLVASLLLAVFALS